MTVCVVTSSQRCELMNLYYGELRSQTHTHTQCYEAFISQEIETITDESLPIFLQPGQQ